MEQFRVRDTETGLFLEGGLHHPTWGKNGKTWKTLGQLRCAFTRARSDAKYLGKKSPVDEIPSTWELVVYEVLELGTIQCNDVIDDANMTQSRVVDLVSDITLTKDEFVKLDKGKPSSKTKKRSTSSSDEDEVFCDGYHLEHSEPTPLGTCRWCDAELEIE